MKPNPLPSYRFAGEITLSPAQTYLQDYLQCPFEVPAGVGALRLRLRYQPLRVEGIDNLITLGLFGPQGFCGNAHRHPPDGEVIVSPDWATVGFIPGPIQPGSWLAQLAVQAVVPSSEPCTWSLEIELLESAPAGQKVHWAIPAPQVIRQKPGWYRGELHSHTLHSDGEFTLEELIGHTRRKQLDFLAITDHNTLSALGEIKPTDSNGLLLIPGMELTTFRGHALVLGVERWIDWRTGFNGWTMQEAARLTHELGGLFIPAHPLDIGNPLCTGCRWEYEDFPLDLADGIEIWNGGWRIANEDCLAYWQLLQKTRRISATCGTDIHSLEDWSAGKPFTYVYASQLSTPAVLEGIRQGRVVISNGPWIELSASSTMGGQEAGIGETLAIKNGLVHLTVRWEEVPPGAHLVLRNQHLVIQNEPLTGSGLRRSSMTAQAGDRLWLELYDEENALLALANPLFIESGG